MGTETGGPREARGSPPARAAGASRVVHPASADAAIALVRAPGRSIVTFLGFSGSGYEDPLAVERAIAKVLDELNPRSVIICAGATPDGIGVVYPLAKKRGFTTIGIVSAVAEREGLRFSPDVDTVFVIADSTWGGLGKDGKLSPTSAVMVGSADTIIAIGGGEIARDEAVAAKAMGKKVRYIAADMNHAAATKKAREKRQPEPSDFRGALHPYFDANKALPPGVSPRTPGTAAGSAPPPVASPGPAVAPGAPTVKSPAPALPATPKTSPPTAQMKGDAPPPPAPRQPTGSLPPDAPAATAAMPAFPWPPPAPSAEHQIRNAWVTKGERTKLSGVAQKLEAALEDADYETWRYSSVPRGFALVTQIEQIRPDGTPRPGKERFRTDLPSLSDMTFVEFLKALAKAPPGYYRVIAFVVTDTPFSRSEVTPTEKEAQQWLHAGLNQLPGSIGALTYADDYRTTALVYEFRKASKNSPAAFVPKSNESGKLHLERAGIWDALTR